MSRNACRPPTIPRSASYYVTDAFYRELIASFPTGSATSCAIDRPGRARPLPPAARARGAAARPAPVRRLARAVFARMHLLGAGDAGRRRSAPRDRDLVRRPPPHGGPHLPAAHRLCLVAGAEVAHGADDLQCRGVRHRAAPTARMVRSNFLISEFRPGRRALPVGLVRPPLRRAGRPLGDRGAPGQPDRLRPEPAQSEHRDLARRTSLGPDAIVRQRRLRLRPSWCRWCAARAPPAARAASPPSRRRRCRRPWPGGSGAGRRRPPPWSRQS